MGYNGEYPLQGKRLLYKRHIVPAVYIENKDPL